MKTLSEKMEMPLIALMCFSLAWFSIILGAAMIAFAIANASKPAPDALSFVLTAVAILSSSIIWFVLSRALILLAQIAHNTRREEK